MQYDSSELPDEIKKKLCEWNAHAKILHHWQVEKTYLVVCRYKTIVVFWRFYLIDSIQEYFMNADNVVSTREMEDGSV